MIAISDSTTRHKNDLETGQVTVMQIPQASKLSPDVISSNSSNDADQNQHALQRKSHIPDASQTSPPQNTMRESQNPFDDQAENTNVTQDILVVKHTIENEDLRTQIDQLQRDLERTRQERDALEERIARDDIEAPPSYSEPRDPFADP